MRISRFEVLGFRSYTNLTTFDFSDRAGLIRLAGDNGSGKSSLWKAICWCLYGKTDDGLTAPQLATWESGAGIYTLCEINGRHVMRSWNANKVTIDEADATQEEVDSVVGLTFTQFLHSRYFAQKQRSFLDLGATEQTDLLASVLELDIWSAYSDKADDARKESERIAQRLGGRIESETAALKELEDEDLEQKRKLWAIEHSNRREVIFAGIDELIDLLEAGDKAVDQARKEVEAARAGRPTSDEDLRAAEASLRRESNRTAVAVADLKRLEGSAKEGKCPTCGQSLPREPMRASALVLKAARDECAEAERVTDLADTRLHGMRKADRAWSDAVNKAADTLDRLGNIQNNREASLKEKRASVRRHDSIDNPWDQIIKERASQCREKRAALEALEALLPSAETNAAGYAYWTKAFKDVRLFLVAEALTQLEVEVNSSLSTLGLPEWEIGFAPDSTTKKGDIKRGFSTTILSPFNPGPVPWNVWSGGETQRLRNACTMGISNLITAYTGSEAFVEVWDEPTNGMTPEGIDALLEALHDRAVTQGKQVWVIDHRSLESGTFDETVLVVKQGNTSTLERIEDGTNQGE